MDLNFLKPTGSTNRITKYADDASLMVQGKNDADLESEFQNVSKWVNDDILLLNMAKTNELVFYCPNARFFVLPPEERVLCTKLLGV